MNISRIGGTSEDRRVRLAGDVLTHNVVWADDVGGYTECVADFAWRAEDQRTNACVVAVVVEDECDCMTCLVRPLRKVIFNSCQSIGVSVANVAAVNKINFVSEEMKIK